MADDQVTPQMARQAEAACVFTNLDTVSDAATGLFDVALKPAALTVEQLGYLVCIHGLPGITVSDMARRKVKDIVHVRTAMLEMESRGWLELATDKDERLSITPLGNRKLDDGAKLWREVQARIVETIGGEEEWEKTLERLVLLHACILSAR